MLIDADDFDHYGAPLSTAAAQTVLLAANYTNAAGFSIQTSSNGIVPPNGLAMLRCDAYQSTLTRPVSSSAINQSQQLQMNWASGLPGSEGWGVSFLDASQSDFLRFVFRSNGSIAITNSNTFINANILAQTAPGVVRSGVWQNWEFVYKPNTGGNNGIAQIWLGGTLICQAIGLSISTACAFHFIGWHAVVGSTPACCIKGWISVDASGSTANNVPLGPRQLSTRIVNGNGATNSWVIGGGAATQWQAVSKNAPDLITYVEGDNPGDVQEFTLPSSPNTIAGVTGLVVKGYAGKSSAGVGTFKIGVLSSGSVINSAELTPGVGGAYYSSGAVTFDPATGNPFTSAAFNAIGLRITRIQ